MELMKKVLLEETAFLKGQVELIGQGSSLDNEQQQAGLSKLAEKLHAVAQNSTTQDWALRQDNNADPFSFTATLIGTRVENIEHVLARAKLDTGCDENWICTELLHRAGIGEHVAPVDVKSQYTAFGGAEIEPVGTIDVSWHAQNAAKSRTTNFLVLTEVPFDMILGREFIAEESIFMFEKPTLALRMGKFSKGNCDIVPINASSGLWNMQKNIV